MLRQRSEFWNACRGGYRRRLLITKTIEQAHDTLAEQAIEDKVAEEVDWVVELLQNLGHLSAEDDRRISRLSEDDVLENRDDEHRIRRRHEDNEADGDDQKSHGGLPVGPLFFDWWDRIRTSHISFRFFCRKSVDRIYLVLFVKADDDKTSNDEAVEDDEEDCRQVDVNEGHGETDTVEVGEIGSNRGIADACTIYYPVDFDGPPDVVTEKC